MSSSRLASRRLRTARPKWTVYKGTNDVFAIGPADPLSKVRPTAATSPSVAADKYHAAQHRWTYVHHRFWTENNAAYTAAKKAYRAEWEAKNGPITDEADEQDALKDFFIGWHNTAMSAYQREWLRASLSMMWPALKSIFTTPTGASASKATHVAAAPKP